MLTEFRTVRTLVAASEAILGKGMAEALWQRFPEVLRLRSQHFNTDLALEAKRRLFAVSVRLVEIETHSYCNRTCWFCPNSFIDRRSARRYLPPSIYARVLADLRSVGFRQRISLSRYNEPFADESIYERLAEARTMLPYCHLQAFSNGDFLSPATLSRAARYGLDELQVSIYLPDKLPWTSQTADQVLAQSAKRIGLRLRQRREIAGQRVSFRDAHRGMKVVIFCPNYSTYGCDRGGTIRGVPAAAKLRTGPCLYTVTDVYIDHTGLIMPCCHLRSDIESHRRLSLGAMDEQPGKLLDIWLSATATHWRAALCDFGAKPAVCRGCTARLWPDTPLARLVYHLGRLLGRSRAHSSLRIGSINSDKERP
jgi:hypothetical protein